MRKIWTMRLMTLAYLAPIALGLAACMSGPGTESQNSGCMGGSSKKVTCGNGTTPVAQSDGSIKCCGNGLSSC